jgi:5'(3')-deoxyribonucleotidase
MSEVRIFFDLDGVLADMEGGLKQNPIINELRAVVDELIDTKFSEYKGLVDDDIKTKFKAELEQNPESPVKELKKAFQKYTSKVFSIAAKPGFYRNLPLMPGAVEMVKKAAELTGKLPNILSAPVGDENDPNNPSVLEKKEWVEEHFGGLVDEVIITIDKGSVVEGKTDILIDDRPRYVDKFTNAGGTAILHTDYTKSISELESLVNQMSAVSERKFVKTYKNFVKK